MHADGAEFLAQLYRPPLRRFPSPKMKPHERARAAAWGTALVDWLAGYQRQNTRREYLLAVASLFNFCRKLPWEVRPADVTGWLEAGLAEKAERTKVSWLRHASRFYQFAARRTWTSPAGRRLRLCRRDPLVGVAWPQPGPPAVCAPLSEFELERLLAAFDRETPFGRRDYALFTVVLETGLRLRQALALRLRDLDPGLAQESGQEGALSSVPALAAGWQAAWQAVQAYLEADGRMASMAPDDYLFTPLQDATGRLARKRPLDWDRKPLHAYSAKRAFRGYVAWAGLDPERVKPETLRYTGARRLLEAGASQAELAAYLRIRTPDNARQIIQRLREQAASCVPDGETTGGGAAAGRPAGSLRRRREGAQPGNRNNLRHGLYSERYRLSRLGIRWRKFHLLRDADLPHIIGELERMQWELIDLPEVSLMNMVHKLNKFSYLTLIKGLLMAYRVKRRRRSE